MGTHALTILENRNGKIISEYSQYNGYPDFLGIEILEFIENDLDVDKMDKAINNSTYTLDWDEVFNVNGFGRKFLNNLQDSNGLLNFNYYNYKFWDVEYVYYLNLRENTFTVFKGYNKEPLNEDEPFFKLTEKWGCETLEYKEYPPKKIVSYNLDYLPDERTFLKLKPVKNYWFYKEVKSTQESFLNALIGEGAGDSDYIKDHVHFTILDGTTKKAKPVKKVDTKPVKETEKKTVNRTETKTTKPVKTTDNINMKDTVLIAKMVEKDLNNNIISTERQVRGIVNKSDKPVKETEKKSVKRTETKPVKTTEKKTVKITDTKKKIQSNKRLNTTIASKPRKTRKAKTAGLNSVRKNKKNNKKIDKGTLPKLR